MGILEQIGVMKSQGASDEEIAGNLKQQGVSPREIMDAMEQARIKNAVSDESQYEPAPDETMQAPNPYDAQTQEAPENAYQPQEEAYYPQPQEGYAQQQYSPSAGGFDTNTIIEISEQVFLEKIQKIQRQVEDFTESRILTQSKINDFENRLKKIEATIDKLQIAILEKVGSYGKDLEGIRKEMGMMQDSFGKIVNKAVRESAEQPSSDNPTRPVKTRTTAKKD